MDPSTRYVCMLCLYVLIKLGSDAKLLDFENPKRSKLKWSITITLFILLSIFVVKKSDAIMKFVVTKS